MPRLAFAILLVASSFADAADDPAFKYTLKHAEDKMAATTVGGTTTFAVTSTTGIGEATIERTGDAWPKAIVLRLNLRALEGFDASVGKFAVHASVNSDSMQSVSITKDGKKVEGYDAKHPLWTVIRMFGPDGKPTDRTNMERGGYFEITLPKDLFEGNPQSLNLNWIDYYRR